MLIHSPTTPEIRLWPPSIADFMPNHHVLGKGFCSKTNRIFLYFFTCHHCLSYYVIYTFKCTGKSSSICMAPRGDNDEGAFVKQPYVLHSIKFQNVCLCISMYVLELFTRAFSTMKGHTFRLAQSKSQPHYKLHSRFFRFRKSRLVISSTRSVMFDSFKPCFNFVGRWKTVQTQIRRHITTLASNQVFCCCSLRFE